MTRSKWRVLWPLGDSSVLPCIGSHCQTTLVARCGSTASMIGGSFSRTASLPIRETSVTRPSMRDGSRRSTSSTASSGVVARADLHADRVGDQRRERDVRAVELAGAVADPQLVRREQVQALALQAQQRALVVEDEHLVAGEHLDGAQRAVVDAARGHEAQAAVDLARDALVALARVGAADEVHVPLVQAVQVGEARAGDRAGEVHRRRGVGVRAHEPARIGAPRASVSARSR